MDQTVTAAGIRRFAITVAPTIVIGESETIFASSDDADSHLNRYHQNRAFLGLYE
jgi:hypothetical protein